MIKAAGPGWHATIEDYLNEEYGKVKIKKGRWFILQTHGEDGLHELWHQCEKKDWDLDYVEYKAFSDWTHKPVIPNWVCSGCGAHPPDSIVTIWCLLEPEHTSEVVQTELSYIPPEPLEGLEGAEWDIWSQVPMTTQAKNRIDTPLEIQQDKWMQDV